MKDKCLHTGRAVGDGSMHVSLLVLGYAGHPGHPQGVSGAYPRRPRKGCPGRTPHGIPQREPMGEPPRSHTGTHVGILAPEDSSGDPMGPDNPGDGGSTGGFPRRFPWASQGKLMDHMQEESLGSYSSTCVCILQIAAILVPITK